MREIKFELVVDNKIVGYETCDPSFDCGVWYHVLRDDPNQYCQAKQYWPPGIKQVIRRQYIGLTDSNGKEIFEGDISILDYGRGNRIAVVEWNKKQTCFQWHTYPDEFVHIFQEVDAKRAEIIGNIYENPELLKAVKG